MADSPAASHALPFVVAHPEVELRAGLLLRGGEPVEADLG
jgi:hypothetical protein